jgi:hypothetical protein
MRYSLLPVMMLVTAVSSGVHAQSAEEQCQMIAALSSDFYVHRQEGKTLDELRQDTPAEFIGTDFARTIELALMLAFTMDESLTEDQLETQVFDSCLRNNPQ